jgi:LacI family transcriptional regulator
MSDIFVQRLAPALPRLVSARFDFRVVDVHRRPRELATRIRELAPHGIVTESLPQLTETIVALGIPTVIADSDITYPGTASIDVDDSAVGRAAAEFFLAGGYEHFACVHNQMPYSAQRLSGFQKALRGTRAAAEFFLPERRPRDYMESWNEPTHRLRSWLRQLPRPVGIFAVHDPLGRLVLDAATEENLRVPEDVAVVGANNDELVCGLSYPPLSSVDIPWPAIGALAAEWIQRLTSGEKPPRKAILVQPGPVAVRHSTTLAAVADPDVRRVIQYFRDHLRAGISVGSACAALRLSRRAVERKFALYLRTSPWERLNAMRVEAAKALLVATTRPLAAIAEETGFSNAERFSVIFNRYTGTSPRNFRKRALDSR